MCAELGHRLEKFKKYAIMEYMKKLGFTLAEVLITLGIIGVVAALTLPSVNQKLEDQRNMAALKKVYSVLQQATNLAISEHENPVYWGMQDNSTESITQMYEYYKPYFNMMRECPNKPGCWAYPTKNLNGTTYWSAHNTAWFQYAFTLTNGTNILMDIYEPATIRRGFGNNVDMDCLIFWVDINADTPPNTIGRDIFAFIVTERGLQPAGLDSTETCTPTKEGWSCVSKIIKDGWEIRYSKK